MSDAFRLVRLALLTAVCVVLGYYFVWENYVILPRGIRNWAQNWGLALPQPSQQLFSQNSPRIDPSQVIDAINQQRQDNNAPNVSNNPDLTKVAELLLKSFAQDNFELNSKDYTQVLENHLTTVGYQFQQASNLALIGKNSTQEVIAEWQLSAYHEALTSSDYTEIGVGIATPFIEGQPVGAVVIVLGQPKKLQTEKVIDLNNQQNTSATKTASIPPPKPIYHPTDDEVMVDLNKYRAAHKVPNLLIDQHLCQYADKRAQDLEAFGGSDGHQGFHDDFSTGELPIGIKDYTGGSIAENLASQYCLNSTTNQSFVAESGAALIEWCFDSSTTGHREAQLNPSYTSACVRHRNHLYVIIFGE